MQKRKKKSKLFFLLLLYHWSRFQLPHLVECTTRISFFFYYKTTCINWLRFLYRQDTSKIRHENIGIKSVLNKRIVHVAVFCFSSIYYILHFPLNLLYFLYYNVSCVIEYCVFFGNNFSIYLALNLWCTNSER